MSSNKVGFGGEELERRGFLRAMALGGAALSSGGVTGCVGSALQPAPVSLDQAEREAARVASALVQLDTRVEGRRGVYSAQGFGVDDAFSPRALRALTYTGLVLDLPQEVRRSQPLVQLSSQLEAELDQTMMDGLWVLAHSGDDARERLDRAVRNNPGFVMDFVERLDLGASEQGLGTGSRMRLRRVAAEINSRLRVESLDSLLGDVTSKMARVMEVSGSEAAHKRLAVTQATLDMFATQEGALELAAAEMPTSRGAPLTRADQHVVQYSVPYLEQRHRRRRTTALAMAGIGAITLGIGVAAVAVSGEIGGAAAITIGSILLVLSLVMGCLAARSRRQLRRRRELEPTPLP
ncbi:MAG: hypothetical protein IPI43_03505 [Sandaracinaceae bacterium]|nr:hypothetical protein [Sandaracinaceae bacterium]